MALRIGAASRVINCRIGSGICGQLYQRICERIHDDLEANACFISNGGGGVLIISLDLLGLGAAFCRRVAARIEKRTGVPAGHILFCCSHTHEGPHTTALLPDVPRDDAYLRQLAIWLQEVADSAVRAARPARAGWGSGRAEIGFNRRLCFADGTHMMYGDPSRRDFTGFEGANDPSQAVLCAWDRKDRVIAIIHHNACHATCMEHGQFASADFPGAARAMIREAVGASVPVLYLQGASGDVSPWNAEHMAGRRPWNGEQRAREMGHLLAGETLRLMSHMRPTANAVVKCAGEIMKMPVRLPSARELAEARRVVAAGKAGTVDWEARWEYVLKWAKLELHRRFKDRPYDRVPVHAVRVGEFAVASNPYECYCQFGLDIKRRSPAAVTAVAQLTNDAVGYCPTIHALLGGGYSGETILWCRSEPYAGYRLVDATCRLLRELW